MLITRKHMTSLKFLTLVKTYLSSLMNYAREYQANPSHEYTEWTFKSIIKVTYKRECSGF